MLDLAAQQRYHKDRGFSARLEHFFEKYAPEDLEESCRFHTDFHHLVRSIQLELSENFTKCIVQVLTEKAKT